MTVGELIDYLADQPRDRIVVLSKDAEGNGFSPLVAANEAMYEASNTWSGEIYLTPEELAKRDDRDEYPEPPDEAVRCVLLDPVN